MTPSRTFSEQAVSEPPSVRGEDMDFLSDSKVTGDDVAAPAAGNTGGNTVIPAGIALAQPAAKPPVTVAATPQNSAQTGSGAPNTRSAPAPVLAVQGDGVNLYSEGRANGPGTPRR